MSAMPRHHPSKNAASRVPPLAERGVKLSPIPGPSSSRAIRSIEAIAHLGVVALCFTLACISTACAPATITTPAARPAQAPPAKAPTPALALNPADEPAVFPPLAWPMRFPLATGLRPETIPALREAGFFQAYPLQGAILPLDTPIQFTRSVSTGAISETDEARKKPEQRIVLALLERLRDQHGVPRDVPIQGEGIGGFIAQTVPPTDNAPPITPRAGRANLAFQFVSFPSNGFPPKFVPELQRTPFFYYDPAEGWQDDGTPINALAPKGLVVILPGMFATPGEQLAELTKQLRQRGYAVLRMMAHPSRFTENIRFFAPTTGDLNPIGSLIADELTNRAAEAAYAVEAALAYVYQERPALRSVKRAAIGTSGGAMILPTVLAREPDTWAAHVSVGGGADYLRILATSNYTDWIDAAGVIWIEPITNVQLNDAMNKNPLVGFVLTLAKGLVAGPTDVTLAGFSVMAQRPMSDAALRRTFTDSTTDVQPTPERRRELFDAYRRHATLDSANLAPRIAHIPTLMIVGTTDRAVPAATAEELWTLLGKPERWQVRGGHEWLFLTLPRRFPEIVTWLDTRLSPEAKPSPSAPIVPPTRTDPAPARP